ncbi:MAG TPA: serine protease [Drouetiella sp.]
MSSRTSGERDNTSHAQHSIDSTSLASASTNEPFSDKLLREANLVWQGTVSGLSDSATDVVQHPYVAAAKVATGAAMSLGIGALNSAFGPSSLVLKTIGTAALGNVIYEIGSKGMDVASSFGDCWRSGANFENDKKQVGGAVGSLAMDTALMAAGSLAGGGWRIYSDAARSARFSDVPSYDMNTVRQLNDAMAENIDKARWSTVLAFETLPNGKLGGHGSGFIFDESGLVATASHVVEGKSQLKIGVMGRNLYDAKVVGYAPEHDCAILKLTPETPGETFPVAKIASENSLASGKVAAVGYPGIGIDYRASVGKVLRRFNGKELVSQGDNITVKRNDGTFNGGNASAKVEPGMSGGPVYNEANEVVGITSAMDEQNGNLQYASIQHLHDLWKTLKQSEKSA